MTTCRVDRAGAGSALAHGLFSKAMRQVQPYLTGPKKMEGQDCSETVYLLKTMSKENNIDALKH